MKLTGEQLARMWRFLHDERGVGLGMADLEAALATLPEPEPVPGAAVRALPAELRGAAKSAHAAALRHTEPAESVGLARADAYEQAAELAAAALEADALAGPVELPTREQLAVRLGDEVLGKGSGTPIKDGGWYRCADYVLSLLRTHAAPKPAESAPRAYPSTPYAGSMGEIVDDQARMLAASKARIADLESRLADVTAKHAVELANNHETVATLNAALEEARSAVTDYSNSYGKAAHRAQDAEGKLQTIFNLSPTLAADDAVGVAVFLKNCAARLERERDEALARLAARPEPVVIDEALALRLKAAFFSEEPDLWEVMVMHALRSVFGDRASVTVPQGEPSASEVMAYYKYAEHVSEVIEERDQLRVELEKTRGELKDCERALGDETQLAEERLALAHHLQADIEAEQSGRLALRKRFGARDDETFGAFLERLFGDNAALIEQHEALRAAAELLVSLARTSASASTMRRE